MQIWVGLGNPGAQYAMHRHNVGFMAVDAIAEVHGFAPPKRAFQGWAQEGRIGGEKILLLKPATFMNESGRAAGEAMRFYKLAPGDVTAFYDELDLAPFKVKVRTGGGTAGHNGIRSLDAHLGPDFRRVRIGIGHPGHKDRVTGQSLWEGRSRFVVSAKSPLANSQLGAAKMTEALFKGFPGTSGETIEVR